ncbi:reverse transcriptase/maturase family protein [Dactylosporangium sp. NPDC049525]|uniref:reverse transcriptase/maturase family protein n=1 Tax=Dactylosporangium sp. NPDC049525 TaxID=3154730 RepID=UPI00343757A7
MNELYRQLFNPQLYLLAYGRIYANHGAMTPGVTQETVDGMSQEKVGRVIDAMRHERFRFAPVRRVHIPKKNGKTRPLGLPTWTDKLVGEVVRLLLEAYYEPTFSDRSHGFRPGRGCHTALREIANTWTGTAWFVEADIADCFGSLDHDLMIGILSEKIHDNRFLRLVRNMLTAGYLEDWKWGATLSGAPQGGVASPILSSIYLHKLDEFVENVLIPEYTRGDRRARNPAYLELQNELAKPDDAATGHRPGSYGGGWSLCPAPTPTIRAIGDCGTADTQTTTCSGSPGRRPKPRRSNSGWRGSCATNSSWNSPTPRR